MCIKINLFKLNANGKGFLPKFIMIYYLVRFKDNQVKVNQISKLNKSCKKNMIKKI
jgi:hypothetical protein